MFYLRFISFYFAVAGFLGIGFLLHTLRSAAEPAAPPPAGAPVTSPGDQRIAGYGVVEARSENLSIGVPEGGLVEGLFVEVGRVVRAGDPLLRLESAELAAEAAASAARVEAARAALARTEAEYTRSRELRARGAAPDADAERLELQVGELRALLAVAEHDRTVSETRLERRTVRAPADGTVLQVNVRPGEYAAPGAATPVLLLGDLSRLRVRAEVDEQLAPLVRPGAGAVAFLKGFPEHPLALNFVRIEPTLLPKRNLAGDASERIDTRVLAVLFELAAQSPHPLYVGQRVDVFLERP